MTPTSYAWLAAIGVLGALALVACFRFGVVDRLARALTHPRPPARREPPRHVSAPSPLPRRSPPCDLYLYPGGDDAA